MYRVVGPGEGWGWESEIGSGRLGYFLLGASQGTNLWRIARVETDHVGRCEFTVIPVTLPHGLPTPEFDAIDVGLREELVQQWAELGRAYVEHRSHALVTAAKNVGEGLLYWKLGDRSGRKRQDLGSLLQKLKSLLDDKLARETAPFSDLDYHLLSKLRLLHARTHPERATRDRLTPELALSAAEDIVAVLRSLHLAE
jgi:IS1 family transposase